MAVFIQGRTVNEAWEAAFKELYKQAEEGFSNDSRDGEVVGELLDTVICVTDPTRSIVTSPIRKMPMRYAVGELLWYLSGSNKVKDIAQYSSVWEGLTDDGFTVNSAYGHRIFHAFGFDQFEHVKNMLSKNPLSRQAVIHIKDPSRAETKDVPCTIALQFMVRQGEDGLYRLNLTVMMRSNDVWKGLPYDAFSFCALQVLMAMQLGVKVGTYTHFATSLHLYKRDYETALKNKQALTEVPTKD